jgi:choline kinase
LIGLVMAAGAGRRLRPDTDQLPKTLLAVTGDRTILDIALRNLTAVGLTDVVVIVGHAAWAVADRVPDLERRHGARIELVHNDRAEDWNNAYSLWLAREHFDAGVLMLNGDTVHPPAVEQALLAARASSRAADLVLAVDDIKKLAAEEMKVVTDTNGQLARITKEIDPALANGEYIGAAIIEPQAAVTLASALEATWRRDPGRYYEDGFQELADRGGAVSCARVGAIDWVEVDNHADLRRAREIAARCLAPPTVVREDHATAGPDAGCAARHRCEAGRHSRPWRAACRSADRQRGPRRRGRRPGSGRQRVRRARHWCGRDLPSA